MSGKKSILFLTIIVAVFTQGCRKPTGSLSVDFEFSVGDKPLSLDTLLYENAAGNRYEISDIQYFISEFTIYDEKGKHNYFSGGTHYVDARMPNTLKWIIPHDITIGKYKQIAFVFGLKGNENFTGRFPNPPENNMSWPQTIGGGYHYMKINGRWIDGFSTKQPFNLHLGKIEEQNKFVDNVFIVVVPVELSVYENQTTNIKIKMDVNEWFENPHIYDFNTFGGAIMQNTEAQKILNANGKSVFSISY